MTSVRDAHAARQQKVRDSGDQYFNVVVRYPLSGERYTFCVLAETKEEAYEEATRRELATEDVFLCCIEGPYVGESVFVPGSPPVTLV